MEPLGACKNAYCSNPTATGYLLREHGVDIANKRLAREARICGNIQHVGEKVSCSEWMLDSVVKTEWSLRLSTHGHITIPGPRC